MQLNHYRRGQGEPLVLIHGIGSRWQMWEPVIDQLVSHHEVIALDLPGFGASPMPPDGTPPGAGSLTDLVLAFLEQSGVQQPHVAGNSLGGLIALDLARRGAVRSATALSPAGFASGGEVALSRALLWSSVRTARWIAPHADAVLRPRAARAIAMRPFLGRPAAISSADAAASTRALAGAAWFDATLPTIGPMAFGDGRDISVPVLIGWGEKDRVLLPRQAERAARAIPGARIISLTGCGHVPTYDDPGLITRVLLEGAG